MEIAIQALGKRSHDRYDRTDTGIEYSYHQANNEIGASFFRKLLFVEGNHWNMTSITNARFLPSRHFGRKSTGTTVPLEA